MNAETRPPARDTLITGKQQENDRMTAHFLDYIKNDVHTHYLKSDSLQNIFFKKHNNLESGRFCSDKR